MKIIGTIATTQEVFFLRTPVDRILFLSLLFSGLLIIGRTLHTGSLTFAFLTWNLFLAYIPYAITNWLQYKSGLKLRSFKGTAVFIGWLLFIPNSFYILTDLFHLGSGDGAPLWYDLALILSCAWNGLLLGLVSVRQMEKFLQASFDRTNEWVFIFPVMFLNALGVYIGRYLRFNSWDVITNPFGLIADMYFMITHPIRNVNGWAMIICFSLFLSIIYVTAKEVSKAFK